MADTYDITYDGVTVGTAKIDREGLYYAFSCRCSLPEEGLYRIHVTVADKREDLGICVPMGGAFGMDKKLSAKRLGVGTPAFELLPKDWRPREIIPEPIAQKKVTPAEEMPEESVETEKESVIQPDKESIEEELCEERFIPVFEEESFDYLDKLDNAHMEIRDNLPGIVIPDEPQQNTT